MKLTIDKGIRTPIYMQIISSVKKGIESGELPAGSKVLSESEIQKEYNVSRVTIRKAYTELMSEGYLVRKQGKGTFVKDIRFCENLVSSSYSATCRELGFQPSSKVIKYGMTKACALDVQELNVNLGDSIPYMVRLRYADNIPVRLERNYYVPKYTGILKEEMNQSIHAILQEKFGLSETQPMHFTIEIAYAEAEEAELLEIKKKSPLLRVHGVLREMNGGAVYRTDMIHLPDRCILRV